MVPEMVNSCKRQVLASASATTNICGVRARAQAGLPPSSLAAGLTEAWLQGAPATHPPHRRPRRASRQRLGSSALYRCVQFRLLLCSGPLRGLWQVLQYSGAAASLTEP